MSETREYKGPIKPGMKYNYADHVLAIPDQDAKRADFVDLFRAGARTLVRPADDDRDAWALFLPDGPLPDTGRKTFKAGQVWAATFDGTAVVFRVRDAKAVSVDTVPGDVLSHRGWWGSSRIKLADVHQSTTVLLFDAPEAATAASPAPVDEAIDWSRFVPGEAARRIKHSNSFQVGQVYTAHTHVGAGIVFEVSQADQRRVRYRLLAGKDVVGQSFDIGSTFAMEATLIRHADGTWAPGHDKSGPVPEKAAPAERQLAPGWVRLRTPGRHMGELAGHPVDVSWGCLDFVRSLACDHTALYAHPNLSGACDTCAEARGVFADRPTTPSPASKPTFVEARAAITKPCPACNGVPFETRRCPRCHMPPKSEPVRVKIRAVGAYSDRGPVHRKWGSMVPDSPKRWLAAQTGIATGLHLEEPRQPTARVGTVPQSLGAGIGIWAARGMR